VRTDYLRNLPRVHGGRQGPVNFSSARMCFDRWIGSVCKRSLDDGNVHAMRVCYNRYRSAIMVQVVNCVQGWRVRRAQPTKSILVIDPSLVVVRPSNVSCNVKSGSSAPSPCRFYDPTHIHLGAVIGPWTSPFSTRLAPGYHISLGQTSMRK
jgi:hypothetical protein